HRDHVDALGANVTHKYYGVNSYENVFKPEEAEAMRAVFSDLAKPENYPIYLHCTYGADRTGTVCFLLEALLGVEKDDLIRDYELTALAHPATEAENLVFFLETLNAFPGNNLKEKTENYLRSIGVTDAEISSLREIYLG
ncbi:MAG: tyrosine-protein phosphatase, partial [Clostridia bacterium]|nr:tyrosine-protein phosphatase [Clostridia bacterium]